MAPAPSSSPFEVFFMPFGRNGRRLCVHTPPRAALRGAVLHVHAFAEEMNKSRRMVARTARALASAGFAVLQVDMLGCGDSDGEFVDARWDDWQSDIVSAASWLTQRYDTPLWLWGHRAGALLACAAAPAISRDCHLLFWNPVLQGRAVTQQFLRLKAAANWASGDGKVAVELAKAELAAGRAIEIAGYRLDPALMREIESAALAAPATNAATHARRLVWLEVAGRDDSVTLSSAAQIQVAKWHAAGYVTSARPVTGPAFWQTLEIEDAPALIDATVHSLCEADSAAMSA